MRKMRDVKVRVVIDGEDRIIDACDLMNDLLDSLVVEITPVGGEPRKILFIEILKNILKRLADLENRLEELE